MVVRAAEQPADLLALYPYEYLYAGFVPPNSPDHSVTVNKSAPFYWNAQLATEQNGQAFFQFSPPADSTHLSFNLLAWTADGRIGTQEISLDCPTDVVIEPHIPSFLYSDDTTQLLTIVRNHSLVPQTVELEFRSDGAEVIGSSSQKIELGPASKQSVSWTVKAGLEATVHFRWSIAGRESSALEREITVRPFGEQSRSAAVGQVPQQFSFELNKSAFDQVGLDLFLSLEQSLAPVFRFIETEDSSRDNQVAALQLLAWLSAPDNIHSDISFSPENAVDFLQKEQLAAGGWSWNRAGYVSDRATTIAVLTALHAAEMTGLNVAKQTVQRGLDELVVLTPADLDPEQQLESQSVLALWGREDKELLATFQNDNLPVYAQSQLALLTLHTNQSDQAHSLLQNLEERVLIADDSAFWLGSVRVGQPAINSILTTAAALRVYLELDPSHERIPQIIRWLQSARDGDRWHDVFHSVQIFIPLIKYAASLESKNSPLDYEVQLNDRLIDSRLIKSAATAPDPVPITPEQLLFGTNKLHINKDGEMPLYYQFILNDFFFTHLTEAQNNGFDVERTYEDRSGNLLSQFVVGDLVRVRLQFMNKSNYSHVRVQEFIPAGFRFVSAVTEDIGTSSLDYQQHIEQEHIDYFIASLPAGKHSVITTMRVMQAGVYRVPSARVDALYTVDVWGRSESDKIEALFLPPSPQPETEQE